jgi:hypothetical protein
MLGVLRIDTAPKMHLMDDGLRRTYSKNRGFSLIWIGLFFFFGLIGRMSWTLAQVGDHIKFIPAPCGPGITG